MKRAKHLISIIVLGILFIANFQGDRHFVSEKDENKTVLLQDFSQDVVVPSIQFVFQAEFILLQISSFEWLVENVAKNYFLNVIFSNSYFEKIFEVHIAINAP